MIKDSATVMHELREYASPKAKLTRMIRSGEILRIRRGLYLEAGQKTSSLKSLAGIIYGPSYISFESALSHYGLIPERTTGVVSAVFNKNKNRIFHTQLGAFYYWYLPAHVYPYGIIQAEENGQSYLIASPEKALCDLLYKTSGITSIDELETLLLEDWRMASEDIFALDAEALRTLAPLYRRHVLMLFMNWFDREVKNA
jgi:predicted transcriptional regulator of viral defense system